MQVSNRCGEGLAADHMDGRESDPGSVKAWPAMCAGSSTVDTGGGSYSLSELARK